MLTALPKLTHGCACSSNAQDHGWQKRESGNPSLHFHCACLNTSWHFFTVGLKLILRPLGVPFSYVQHKRETNLGVTLRSARPPFWLPSSCCTLLACHHKWRLASATWLDARSFKNVNWNTTRRSSLDVIPYLTSTCESWSMSRTYQHE